MLASLCEAKVEEDTPNPWPPSPLLLLLSLLLLLLLVVLLLLLLLIFRSSLKLTERVSAADRAREDDLGKERDDKKEMQPCKQGSRCLLGFHTGFFVGGEDHARLLMPTLKSHAL